MLCVIGRILLHSVEYVVCIGRFQVHSVQYVVYWGGSCHVVLSLLRIFLLYNADYFVCTGQLPAT
jgi:hypothetical protein